MDEHKVERTNEGYMIVLKTEGFRLAISDDSFSYLTDAHTGPGVGCTCHISTTWDIQNLRALLDEAEKVLQGRELADEANDDIDEEDFEPNEDTEMFCDWEEDEAEVDQRDAWFMNFSNGEADCSQCSNHGPVCVCAGHCYDCCKCTPDDLPE